MKIENFDEFQLPQSLIFFADIFAHVSYLTMSSKRWSGFFLFSLGLELLIKV